jgi:hypothetical protein
MLSYENWHTFNVNVRIAQDNLKLITPAVVACLVTGIEYPILSTGTAALFFVLQMITCHG